MFLTVERCRALSLELNTPQAILVFPLLSLMSTQFFSGRNCLSLLASAHKITKRFYFFIFRNCVNEIFCEVLSSTIFFKVIMQNYIWGKCNFIFFRQTYFYNSSPPCLSQRLISTCMFYIFWAESDRILNWAMTISPLSIF